MSGSSSTTVTLQRYLNDLGRGGGESAEAPVVRALLTRSVRRLRFLCSVLLYRHYRRLTWAPSNLATDELLSAVVERLLKALEHARPKTVAEYFALANQHMRWELNDFARRLDDKSPSVELLEGFACAHESNESCLSQNARRMLAAIDELPQSESEAFSLVRIQGLSLNEAAELLGVSKKTVQRRLNLSLLSLKESLADLRPDEQPTPP